MAAKVVLRLREVTARVVANRLTDACYRRTDEASDGRSVGGRNGRSGLLPTPWRALLRPHERDHPLGSPRTRPGRIPHQRCSPHTRSTGGEALEWVCGGGVRPGRDPRRRALAANRRAASHTPGRASLADGARRGPDGTANHRLARRTRACLAHTDGLVPTTPRPGRSTGRPRTPVEARHRSPTACGSDCSGVSRGSSGCATPPRVWRGTERVCRLAAPFTRLLGRAAPLGRAAGPRRALAVVGVSERVSLPVPPGPAPAAPVRCAGCGRDAISNGVTSQPPLPAPYRPTGTAPPPPAPCRGTPPTTPRRRRRGWSCPPGGRRCRRWSRGRCRRGRRAGAPPRPRGRGSGSG